MTASLAAWLHTIDPYAIQLWEGGPIRWYGLSYLVGFLIAYLLVRRVARVGVSTLDYRRAADLIITFAISIVIGGRLGYVVFYKPELLIEFSDSLPYWGVLNIAGGGMSSHGGMIGGLAGAWYFAFRHKQPILHLFDLLAFAAPLGLFCGRVANFINGELFGRVCGKEFPLAVQFPQEAYESQELYNALTQAYGRELPRNWLDLLQSGNEALQQAAIEVLPARHASQLYAGVLEGLVVFAVLALIWLKPKRSGTIAGAFGITYAIMRLINENFREPDAHLGEQLLGLTRGQWLSVPLLLAGVGLVVLAYRLKRPLMGSWRRGEWTRLPATAEGEPESSSPKPE
ncbi:prolipoprotein diacylglyceryl transferase [Algisphaera agarilytica]|uniref:Phosphatidylglycerol--prolipoprotein diacylglyceryl transferase n=1 Tax=Algisphaera agarilytica TaxID=1385975 RepID=A0A7X0H5N9_9BACT|nr:prolipoprotein diacylglyceryl transferase [Algisphaera agarilytica]MBB6429747.1 phosphatidylglycerol:prolipoprotein diacylglycerol transferase [Algisphaera agarilytica]